MIKKVILMNYILLVILVPASFGVLISLEEAGGIGQYEEKGRTMGILTSVFIMCLAPFVTALALKIKSRGMRRISYMTNGFTAILFGFTAIVVGFSLTALTPEPLLILSFSIVMILPFLINLYTLIKTK
jgi:predicted neutral ceramidase superfamily lipid hydrolase